MKFFCHAFFIFISSKHFATAAVTIFIVYAYRGGRHNFYLLQGLCKSLLVYIDSLHHSALQQYNRLPLLTEFNCPAYPAFPELLVPLTAEQLIVQKEEAIMLDSVVIFP